MFITVATHRQDGITQIHVVHVGNALSFEIEQVAVRSPVVVPIDDVVPSDHRGIAEIKTKRIVDAVHGMRIERRDLLDPDATLSQFIGQVRRPANRRGCDRSGAVASSPAVAQLRQKVGRHKLLRHRRRHISRAARVAAKRASRPHRTSSISTATSGTSVLGIRQRGTRQLGAGHAQRATVVSGIGHVPAIDRLIDGQIGTVGDGLSHGRHPSVRIAVEPMRDQRHARQQVPAEQLHSQSARALP